MSDSTKLAKVDLQFGGYATAVALDEQGRWSLNDLHKAAGGAKAKEVNRWRKLAQTQEIIDILQADYPGEEVIVSSRGGKNPGTFVAPELAIDYASWISPHFRVATSRVVVELTRRGYVVADRWYNVADIVRMYRRRNGEAYSDHMEPLEGHNDIGYYAEGTTEEQYRKAREIGRVRLERLSKREWSHPDKYHFVKEGADPGGNGDGPCNSWCASRYYFVRVDEVYNLIDVLFGDEIGHFAPEWRHREEEMLSGLPRYRRASLDDPFLAHQLSLNLHKPPLITWDSWADALNSDEDMPA